MSVDDSVVCSFTVTVPASVSPMVRVLTSHAVTALVPPAGTRSIRTCRCSIRSTYPEKPPLRKRG